MRLYSRIAAVDIPSFNLIWWKRYSLLLDVARFWREKSVRMKPAAPHMILKAILWTIKQKKKCLIRNKTFPDDFAPDLSHDFVYMIFQRTERVWMWCVAYLTFNFMFIILEFLLFFTIKICRQVYLIIINFMQYIRACVPNTKYWCQSMQ